MSYRIFSKKSIDYRIPPSLTRLLRRNLRWPRHIDRVLAPALEGAHAPPRDPAREPGHPLCGAQVVPDAVSEQPLDEGVTGRPDVFAVTQTSTSTGSR